MWCHPFASKVHLYLEDDDTAQHEENTDDTVYPERPSASVFEPVTLDWSVLDDNIVPSQLLHRAGFFAIIAAEAYYGHAQDTSIFCKANSFDSVKMVVVGETACLIVVKDDHIVVGFRGTNSFQDAWDDMNIRPVLMEEFSDVGLIHEGFKNYLVRVRDKLEEYLRSTVKPHSKVWFTGHSLGAAAALLMSAIWEEKQHISEIYTYGSPRVGNWKWQHYMNATFKNKIFRVVNYRDPVASVPGRFLGYFHVGQIVYLSYDRKAKLHWSLLRRLLDKNGLFWFGRMLSTRDHLLKKGYCVILQDIGRKLRESEKS